MKFWTRKGIIQLDELPERYEKLECSCGDIIYQGPTEFYMPYPARHNHFEDVDCIGRVTTIESHGTKGISPGEPPAYANSGELIEGTSAMKEHRNKAEFTKQAVNYIFNNSNNDREVMKKKREEVNKEHSRNLVGGKI